MLEVKSIAHALHYLISKYSNNDDKIANRMAILKLFFFAQRYHLRAYGRLIAKDRFVAMSHGPVSSIALDLMKENYANILTADKDFSKNFIRSYDKWSVQAINDAEDYEELSETDIEALDFALDNFGNLDQWELVSFTHDYPEWKKHEAELKERKSVNMDILDLFGDNPQGSPYDTISADKVELNKLFFMGAF